MQNPKVKVISKSEPDKLKFEVEEFFRLFLGNIISLTQSETTQITSYGTTVWHGTVIIVYNEVETNA